MAYWSEAGSRLTEEERRESLYAQASFLQQTSYERTANDLVSHYDSLFGINTPEAITHRVAIEEALDQLYTRHRRDQLGHTLFDRLAEGARPSPTVLERDPFAGLQMLKINRVRDLLGRLLQQKRDLNVLNHFSNYKQKYRIDSLQRLKQKLTTDQWNDQFFMAIGFRLSMIDEEHENINKFALRENVFDSVCELIEALDTQEDLEGYLAQHNLLDTETLWQARMKIIFNSLSLAQKGACNHGSCFQRTEKFFRRDIARINQSLGEMGITVRHGGPHLKHLLDTQRKLTEAVVLGELYKDDPEYGQKIMADYDRYTSSLDSFLISIDAGPVFTAGEVLIAKVSSHPLTYTVEFLYVDKDYREHYALGTLAQNIALSLIPPRARIIATVYSANPNLPRHFKRGWVGTGLINGGKTLELEFYKPKLRNGGVLATARNYEEFIKECDRYLNDHILTDVEKPIDPEKLFPWLLQFAKKDPKTPTYRDDLPQAA